MNDETVFLLERQRRAGKRLSNIAQDERNYQDVRNQVLEGLVKCALVKLDNGIAHSGIKENLRCDLQQYIGE